MLEAVHTDLVFTISLKRSTQNLPLSTSSPADYPIFGSRVDGALARIFWRSCSIGRVRSRVRPVDAADVPLAL